ncbi:MAG: hypothetical protein GZ088_05045 [Acidipila sp.]|nr:hypothetical protein [Acidipila sp.]
MRGIDVVHFAGSATCRVLLSAGLALAAFVLAPAPLSAWGPNGHRLIANKAMDTLPPELRPWFEGNRSYITQHVTDPIGWLAKNPAERRNQTIQLEKYGHFPFEALPRDYRAAVRKFTKSVVEANGLLPWQIGFYSQRLTESFRDGKWDDARQNAALLAHYIEEAHDPFSTTENFDGHLAGQVGVQLRFGTALIDRFALFIYVRPSDASKVDDPTDHAFEVCLTAHGWVEPVLLADRRARHGLPDYTDEYFDRFFNSAGSVLIRQLSDASTDVGSYWLTAWINAGRPALPSQ